MAGFGLLGLLGGGNVFGGSSAKTNRKFQLNSMADLNNLYNYAIPQGEAAMSAGQADIGAASNYWQNILSGNRTALNAAVAPERNMILSSQDAARKQQSTMGTARGGGVASQNVQQGTQAQSAIDQATLAARPAAAKGLESTGSAELNAAFNALGLGEGSASSLGSIASGKPATADTAAAEGNQLADTLWMAFDMAEAA
jgi:hypothetical protein